MDMRNFIDLRFLGTVSCRFATSHCEMGGIPLAFPDNCFNKWSLQPIGEVSSPKGMPVKIETAIPAMPERSQPVEQAMIALYALIVLFGLASFGAAHIEAQSALSIAAAIFAVIAAGLYGMPPTSRPLANAALGLMLGLVCFALLQTLDLHAIGLGSDAWDHAARLTGSSAARISVAPAETRLAVTHITCPLLIFLGGLSLARDDRMAERMLLALAVTGGLLATATLAGFIIDPSTLMMTRKIHYLRDFTASFVNRNTAATFLGMTLLLLSTLAFQAARDGGIRGPLVPHRQHLRQRKRLALTLGLAIAALIGLMMTRSRAGIAATSAGAVVLVPLLLLTWRYGRYRLRGQTTARTAAKLIAITVPATIFVLWLISGKALLRADIQGFDDQRFCIYPLLWRGFEAHWLTGQGFGSFRQAFPALRDGTCGIEGVFDRGHDFYLEGLMGLGILFAVAAGFALFHLLSAFIAGWRRRRSARPYSALGLALSAMVLLHAVFDFSLQLPGIAAYVAAVMAPLCAISRRRDATPAIATDISSQAASI